MRNRRISSDAEGTGKSNANGSPHLNAAMHTLFEKLDIDQRRFGQMKLELQVEVQDLMLVFVNGVLDRGEGAEMKGLASRSAATRLGPPAAANI